MHIEHILTAAWLCSGWRVGWLAGCVDGGVAHSSSSSGRVMYIELIFRYDRHILCTRRKRGLNFCTGTAWKKGKTLLFLTTCMAKFFERTRRLDIQPPSFHHFQFENHVSTPQLLIIHAYMLDFARYACRVMDARAHPGTHTPARARPWMKAKALSLSQMRAIKSIEAFYIMPAEHCCTSFCLTTRHTR